MILVSKYDEVEKIEKVFYESSNIYYSKAVEHKDGTKIENLSGEATNKSEEFKEKLLELNSDDNSNSDIA
jgi:hypothetical protein